jgi:hypothetical protein
MAWTPAESTLYLLGEQDRIIGISGYVVRPQEPVKRSRASALYLGERRQDPCPEA